MSEEINAAISKERLRKQFIARAQPVIVVNELPGTEDLQRDTITREECLSLLQSHTSNLSTCAATKEEVLSLTNIVNQMKEVIAHLVDQKEMTNNIIDEILDVPEVKIYIYQKVQAEKEEELATQEITYSQDYGDVMPPAKEVKLGSEN